MVWTKKKGFQFVIFLLWSSVSGFQTGWSSAMIKRQACKLAATSEEEVDYEKLMAEVAKELALAKKLLAKDPENEDMFAKEEELAREQEMSFALPPDDDEEEDKALDAEARRLLTLDPEQRKEALILERNADGEITKTNAKLMSRVADLQNVTISPPSENDTSAFEDPLLEEYESVLKDGVRKSGYRDFAATLMEIKGDLGEEDFYKVFDQSNYFIGGDAF